LSRALWCTLQMVLGLLLIFAAQAWALMAIVADDERLSGKDAVIAFRLWGLTLSRLPRTHRQVWLGAWGLATLLSAVFLIGGLEHWLTYLPRKAPAASAPKQG